MINITLSEQETSIILQALYNTQVLVKDAPVVIKLIDSIKSQVIEQSKPKNQ